MNLDEYNGEKDPNRQVVSIIEQHLQSLTECSYLCHPNEEDPWHGNMWIIDPLAANIKERKLNMNEIKSIIHLSCDDSQKTKFQSSLLRPHF